MSFSESKHSLFVWNKILVLHLLLALWDSHSLKILCWCLLHMELRQFCQKNNDLVTLWWRISLAFRKYIAFGYSRLQKCFFDPFFLHHFDQKSGLSEVSLAFFSKQHFSRRMCLFLSNCKVQANKIFRRVQSVPFTWLELESSLS